MAQNEPGGERLGAKASNSAGREKGEERTDLRGVDIATLGDCWSTGGEWNEAADKGGDEVEEPEWLEGGRAPWREGGEAPQAWLSKWAGARQPGPPSYGPAAFRTFVSTSLLFSYINQNVNSHPNSISSQYGEGTDL